MAILCGRPALTQSLGCWGPPNASEGPGCSLQTAFASPDDESSGWRTYRANTLGLCRKSNFPGPWPTPSSSPSLAAGCSDVREPVNATLLDSLARSDQRGGQGWIATHDGESVDEAGEGETISR